MRQTKSGLKEDVRLGVLVVVSSIKETGKPL
jgi:hypothetical protein